MYSPDKTKPSKKNRQDAEMGGTRRKLNRPANSEFAHASLESGALHSKKGRGAFRAGDAPSGLAKGAENVLALGLFKCGDRGRGGSQSGEVGRGVSAGGRIFAVIGEGRGVQFGERNAKFLAGREEHGALDEIFEFADVARPGII